jgi:Domain of unknown function (DUF1998)
MAPASTFRSTANKPAYRRRVGTARPSHLMFTGGVGALIDLPNFSVLVDGLDDWRYDTYEYDPVIEPRLLDAVRRLLGPSVKELRTAPWLEDDESVSSPAKRTGVPVTPFPQWLRCTACGQLAALDSAEWGFENDQARRPDRARFFHKNCRKVKAKRKPMAVAARFLLACAAGHLDDFPYVQFIHHGGDCPNSPFPVLSMDDHGGNQGANVTLRCGVCTDAKRNIREALGKNGEANLPRCRGRHPHLKTFVDGGCQAQSKMLVLGASNQWFAQTLNAFSVPQTGAGALETKIEQLWDSLADAITPDILKPLVTHVPALKQQLSGYPLDTVFDAVGKHRARLLGSQGTSHGDTHPDLRTPEWEIFTATPPPEPTDEFTLRRDPQGIPAALRPIFSDIVEVERLREVRALIGFTRLDAPDPEDPDLVARAPLARSAPTWVPASEVRGEGIFLRVDEDLLSGWESDIAGSAALHAHREAFQNFRKNRYSDRIAGPFDPLKGWPGARYIALHTLSHLLIRTIALECGYSSASLSERIYAGTPDDPRGGILVYTAVPDAEGTLGGLVSLAEPEPLARLMRRALRDARRCSSDPLCAERLPKPGEDFLHGAACHVCMFVSETTCERGNRFLDRRFVVPVADPALALLPAEL